MYTRHKIFKKNRIALSLCIGSISLLVIVFLFLANKRAIYNTQSNHNQAEFFHKTAVDFSLRCAMSTYNQKCYQEEFFLFAKTHSLNDSQQVLEQLWDIDPATKGCHSIAHKISLAEVAKNPAEWNTLLKNTNPQSCSGGFFHGIIEGHSRFDPTFTLDNKHIDKMCGLNSTSYTKMSCSHIIGHLLLVDNNANIYKAAAICQQLNENLVDECYSGIFMENMTRDDLIEHGLTNTHLAWNDQTIADIEKVCATFWDQAARGCWGEMGHMYAAVYKDNPQVVYSLCMRAQNSYFIENCYLHAVNKISVTSNNMEDIIKLCDPYQAENNKYVSCVDRVINVLLTTSIKFFDRATSYCSGLPAEYKNKCFESIGRNLSMTIPNQAQRVNLCKKLEEKYQSTCSI